MSKIRNFANKIKEAHNSYFTMRIVKIGDEHEIRHVLTVVDYDGHHRSYVLTNEEYEKASIDWRNLYC